MNQSNLSGTWQLKVKVGDKGGVATFELVEGEGGALSGTYTGQVGTAEVSGTVRGPEVEFSFDWHAGKVTYEGTYTDDRMSGRCTYGSAGDGTFEGGKSRG